MCMVYFIAQEERKTVNRRNIRAHWVMSLVVVNLHILQWQLTFVKAMDNVSFQHVLAEIVAPRNGTEEPSIGHACCS
jgi:hypothetical protein